MKRILFLLVLTALLLLIACSDPQAETAPTPTLDPIAAQGKDVFSQECTICHATTPGAVLRGPSLYGIATSAAIRIPNTDARSYIYTSILRPGDYLVDGFGDIMLNDFGKKLTSEELDAVVTYLLTLQE